MIGLATLAVATITRPFTLPPAEAILSVDSDQVQLKKSGSEAWVVVTQDTEIEVGDTVWTNTTGGATITLFDQGVMRLDADTTVTIEQADIDPEHPEIFHGQIFLEQGQLWSRVFDFISPESSYQVRTSSTVATVRGTIFDVWQHGEMSGVYVEEHEVHVTNAGHEKMVAQGDFMNMDPRANTLMDMNADMSEDMQTWVHKNRECDVKFDQDMAKKLQSAVRRKGLAKIRARDKLYERMTTLMNKTHEAPTDPTPNFKLETKIELKDPAIITDVKLVPAISR